MNVLLTSGREGELSWFVMLFQVCEVVVSQREQEKAWFTMLEVCLSDALVREKNKPADLWCFFQCVKLSSDKRKRDAGLTCQVWHQVKGKETGILNWLWRTVDVQGEEESKACFLNDAGVRAVDVQDEEKSKACFSNDAGVRAAVMQGKGESRASF